MKQQAAQVYFPFATYLEIKQMAVEENLPFAAWIRDAADQKIRAKRVKKKSLADMPTFSFGDDPYLSEHIDEVLYDNP